MRPATTMIVTMYGIGRCGSHSKDEGCTECIDRVPRSKNYRRERNKSLTRTGVDSESASSTQGNVTSCKTCKETSDQHRTVSKLHNVHANGARRTRLFTRRS